MRFISPLRYPGGKSKLAPLIHRILYDNGLIGGRYIEPFAGGASIALYLLLNNLVKQIHINDKDVAIYSFWKSIVDVPHHLIDKINKTPITIEEWYKQKEIYSRKEEYSGTLELAFATLFLNRCNRSGILTAGPIGGYSQSGKWTVDCRFSKEDIIRRIEKIARYQSRILVTNCDAAMLLQNIEPLKDTFVYLDPPYYKKGPGLYMNAYTDADHETLKSVVDHMKVKWLVSYDNQLFIQSLYSQYHSFEFQLTYSAHKHTKGSEILLWDDLIMPKELLKSPKIYGQAKDFSSLLLV